MKHFISYCIVFLSFYLGLHNGNLAIWEDGRSTPVIVLPYDASLFPIKDQNRLKEGIHFENHDELSVLLEDFIS